MVAPCSSLDGAEKILAVGVECLVQDGQRHLALLYVIGNGQSGFLDRSNGSLPARELRDAPDRNRISASSPAAMMASGFAARHAQRVEDGGGFAG